LEVGEGRVKGGMEIEMGMGIAIEMAIGTLEMSNWTMRLTDSKQMTTNKR
jgi:hypothetical protein